MGERYCILLFTPTHTSGLIGKLGCVIGKLKNRSVCMQSAFLLFCCCDEKSMQANLSPSSTSTTMLSGLEFCQNMRVGITNFSQKCKNRPPTCLSRFAFSKLKVQVLKFRTRGVRGWEAVNKRAPRRQRQSLEGTDESIP